MNESTDKKLTISEEVLSQSAMHLIPVYNIFRFIFGLPPKQNIVNASNNLIFIHNGHDGALANQGVLNCYAAQKARIC